MSPRHQLIAAAALLAGCASNNVAELAGQVLIVESQTETRGCRPVGSVDGAAMTETGARHQAQVRTLFLGGDRLLQAQSGRATPPVMTTTMGGASTDIRGYRGGFTGYAFDCSRGAPLSSKLVGVTFVPPGQITVSRDKPTGCDGAGEALEAFSDARPGSAEEGLRRAALLARANYVHVLKTVDYDGRSALRGQPYVCAIR
jgi:hypothetical protein